jgi:hypothetical protein
MKNLLLVAIAAVLFVACSKKNNPAPSSALTGKWYVITDTIREYQDNALTEVDTVKSNRTDYVQFNADKTGTVLNNGVLSNFTYTYSGNTIIISIPQTASNGTAKAPLIQTVTINTLTPSNLAVASVVTIDFGTGIIFKETENESFEK